MMSLVSIVTQFLHQRLDPMRPLLLALSGGPDSLALFHALLEIRKKKDLTLHVAHVDHRWRAESAAEAAQLQQLCDRLEIPFHLHVLEQGKPALFTFSGRISARRGVSDASADDEGIASAIAEETDEVDEPPAAGRKLTEKMNKAGKPSRNAEEVGRRERLAFFSSVCHQTGCQAVLVAHHADDLAENVLKKLFEGSSLMRGSGLRPVTKMEGLVIWRPLLKVPKAHIVAWLETREIVAFEDSTNNDPIYLRTRMRQRLVPMLSESFGKDVVSGLCAVGEEADALSDYFDECLASYLAAIEKIAVGYLLDLSRERPESVVEMAHLIRRICDLAGFVLSREALKAAIHLVANGAAGGQVAMGTGTLYIDRYRLFACSGAIEMLPKETAILLTGKYQLGPWQVDVAPGAHPTQHTGWREALRGKLVVPLPAGDYHIGIGKPNAYCRGRKLGKLWSDHQVPTFLRYRIPVVWNGDEVYCEFLTGQCNAASECTNLLTLSLWPE